MKKLLALSAAALLSTTAFAADPVTKQTVHISGEVYDQTCTLDDTNAHQFVILDKIKLSDLKNGETSNKPFTVKFKDCDTKSSQQVFVSFDGAHSTVASNGKLNNILTSNPNSASGVQIQLFQENGTPIDLKDAESAKSTNKPVQRTLANGKVEFKFQAGYFAEANPTTGIVSSNIPVTLQYQ